MTMVVARFRDRPTQALEIASAAWTAGEAVYLVGLVVFAYRAGGAPAVALVALLQALPSVVLAPLVLSMARSIPDRLLLRLVLLARVLTVAVGALAVALPAPIALVYVVAATDGVASTLLRPIRSALIPMIARSPPELISANVAITTGANAAGLAGPALAAALLVVTGVEATFAAGAIMLVAALAVSARLGPVAGAPPYAAPRAVAVGRPQRLAALAGLGAARTIITVLVGQRFVRGMLNVLIATTALELVRTGDEGVGVLNAAIGFGGLVGSGVSVALIGRSGLAAPLTVALVVWGTGFTAPALVPYLLPAVLFLMISGAGKATLDVAGSSLLQRTLPTAIRRQALAMLESMVTLALAAGAVSASILVEALGPGTALLAAGSLTFGIALLGWPRLRAVDAATVIPERELRLLRGVAFFRPLQLTTLEQLAGALETVSVPAGAEVVRQGEPGDRFYIVESGRLATEVDGRHARDLIHGDSFGEIALLRDVPRTATIRATSDTQLVVLARDEFLAAVSGHGESASLADEVVRSRFGR